MFTSLRADRLASVRVVSQWSIASIALALVRCTAVAIHATLLADGLAEVGLAFR